MDRSQASLLLRGIPLGCLKVTEFFVRPSWYITVLLEYQSKTPKNGCTHRLVGATVFGCFALGVRIDVILSQSAYNRCGHFKRPRGTPLFNIMHRGRFMWSPRPIPHL